MKVNQVITESLADEFAAMARAKGMNVRVHGTPEQERERTQQMLAQRAADREKASADAAKADVDKLPELKAEYEAMRAEYKALGGSDWQYADREQNLTDRERKARSMEGPMNNLWRQIQAAEKAQGQQGVAEGLDNITAVFSGHGNYMKGRGANVFKHYGITVLDKQYFEDEDIAEYTVSGSKEALDKARAYLERSDQFGGMLIKQGVAEGSMATKHVAPVKATPLSTERPKGEWDPIHGKAPKKGTVKYDIWRQKVSQDKKGVAEGDISQLEKAVADAPVEPIANMESKDDQKIGGRHDPDDFDAMVNRLKKLAGSGPLKTVYDPKTRRYKNMPTAVQPGDKK